MGFPVDVRRLIRSKKDRKKWAMLTAYDAPTAQILEEAGIDLILVGDSLGMVVLGYPTTAPVTMDEMIHHAKAVRRGAPKSFIIGDMPLKGVEKGPAQALASARRFVKEGGCDAVKLEWRKDCLTSSRRILGAGIPVMGHVGLTPQAVKTRKGFRVQGQDAKSALAIFKAATAFEDAGAFAVLLECVPRQAANAITRSLRIPVIGIGAGPDCDGQVLVFHDLTGLFRKFTPRFVKRYADLGAGARRAVAAYACDVRRGRFPARAHSFDMKRQELEKFLRCL